ncbi:MAG: DEAD/DEAH box helicase [Sandaracinaceae bacterium]|nr:DEAD/DEAH box helicase [Sandaracinaceae bacterium]
MVWREGVIPEGGPSFHADLTDDLLDYGYAVLAVALELRDANLELGPDREPYATDRAFTTAAECIEAAVRRGPPEDPDRGRHLVVAAAAFHLAGYAARSFSLLPSGALTANLASMELALARLLRRELRELREFVRSWLAAPENRDDAIATRLADEDDAYDVGDAVVAALNASYFRSLGRLDSALVTGDQAEYDRVMTSLESLIAQAHGIGNLTAWWVATLTKHLGRDLWEQSLHQRMPLDPTLPDRWPELRSGFIDVLGSRARPQLDLWPSQLDAARRSVDPADDLIVALPTSSGKTRIAELCILRALADEKRVMYVTPLRALSAQVEQTLARTFVPLGASVTSLYGAAGATTLDVKTLATADVVVATPEKLDFALRQDPHVLDEVALIVFDEGHMIGSGSREIRYEVLIQRLLRRDDADARRIVCLSAMFNASDEFFHDFGAWLRNDSPGDVISVEWRPTRQLIATLEWQSGPGRARLQFVEAEGLPYVPRFFEAQAPVVKRRKKPFPQDDKEFCVATALTFARDGHDVLVYSPQRRQIEPLVDVFCKNEKQGFLGGVRRPSEADIEVALAIGREWLGEDHPAVRALPIGIGTHHGSLPRPFLSAVEELLHARKLPVVVASPTLAQGIDLACSVLIFRSLRRFDRAAGRLLPIEPAEFSNVLGRAGRAYVDLDGIAVLPVFENGREINTFLDLVKSSRGQTLVSGVALLLLKIAKELAQRLSVPQQQLFDYVFNQQDLWSDERLGSNATVNEGDEDDLEQDLDDLISDLDVAILSLIEDVDASVETLAEVLDRILTGSLWQRTLARVKDGPAIEKLEREIVLSRTRWLWSATSPAQRKACFASGLGKRAGVFLYDNLDALVAHLADLHQAVRECDADKAQEAAVAFAEIIFAEPFFVPNDMPEEWREVLGAWVAGEPFAQVLARSKKAAGFIHDGVIFKLVWAAEAVRVQAATLDHARLGELGDGPALALTNGQPSLSAALLCQYGYASRAGALWLIERLGGDFVDGDGLFDWEYDHGDQLGDPDFWASADHRLLWERSRSGGGGPRPKEWKHTAHEVDARWQGARPKEGTPIRPVATGARRVALCRADLTTLGEAVVPFDPRECALRGRVVAAGRVELARFGPS